MVDDEIDVRQQARKIMRLDVHQRDLVEVLEVFGFQRLNLEIEQLHHAEIFGSRHRLETSDHRRLPRAFQHGAQGKAAGHGIRIRIVVRQDQHPVRIVQIAQILLHASAA